jgi:hypothetical protein
MIINLNFNLYYNLYLSIDHPLLPMPMNVTTAPMNNLQSQSSMNIGNSSNQGQLSSNSMQYNTSSASGYSMQVMDGRSCVVQVSNFPEQVFKNSIKK